VQNLGATINIYQEINFKILLYLYYISWF